MIFRLLLFIHLSGSIQIFQPGNIAACHVGSSFCFGNRISAGLFCVCHGCIEIARRLRQFPQRWRTIVCRCISQKRDSCNYAADCSRQFQSDASGAGKHCCQIESRKDLPCSGDRCHCCANGAKRTGCCANRFYKSGVILYKICDILQNIVSNIVKIPKNRGESVSDCRPQVVDAILHHVHLGLRCGIALACLCRQCHVLAPRRICS